jgi:hypothetical protein
MVFDKLGLSTIGSVNHLYNFDLPSRNTRFFPEKFRNDVQRIELACSLFYGE